MGRIWKAYATQFRWLLLQAGARKLEAGIDRLQQRATRLSQAERIAPAAALTRIHESLARHPFFRNKRPVPVASAFWCDAGLGGLARWLRAAGYRAWWDAAIDDDDLLARAARDKAALLTTDSMLMERRLLRDRVIVAFWLPPTLQIAEQLDLIFREFGLSVGSPRCMSCGGELKPGDKQALRDQIPPRTFRWRDEYFVCADCGKLFWHGTHWEKIQTRLRQAKTRTQVP